MVVLMGIRSEAAVTNDFSVGHLAHVYVPQCVIATNHAGTPKALVSPSGEVLDLLAAARENPMPSNNVAGYWFSPTMDFLSRQKVQVASPGQAVAVVQLLHAIWRGPDFVREKIYRARRIDLGWLIEVEHDFTNYPGNVFSIPPYELLVDTRHTVLQMRQRCYDYPGSVKVYTNTVSSVYEREIKANRGLNYPEALFKELREAWEREKKQMGPSGRPPNP